MIAESGDGGMILLCCRLLGSRLAFGDGAGAGSRQGFFVLCFCLADRDVFWWSDPVLPGRNRTFGDVGGRGGVFPPPTRFRFAL